MFNLSMTVMVIPFLVLIYLLILQVPLALIDPNLAQYISQEIPEYFWTSFGLGLLFTLLLILSSIYYGVFKLSQYPFVWTLQAMGFGTLAGISYVLQILFSYEPRPIGELTSHDYSLLSPGIITIILFSIAWIVCIAPFALKEEAKLDQYQQIGKQVEIAIENKQKARKQGKSPIKGSSYITTLIKTFVLYAIGSSLGFFVFYLYALFLLALINPNSAAELSSFLNEYLFILILISGLAMGLSATRHFNESLKFNALRRERVRLTLVENIEFVNLSNDQQMNSNSFYGVLFSDVLGYNFLIYALALLTIIFASAMFVAITPNIIHLIALVISGWIVRKISEWISHRWLAPIHYDHQDNEDDISLSSNPELHDRYLKRMKEKADRDMFLGNDDPKPPRRY